MSKTKYNSSYGDRSLSSEEYLAELVCENIARRNRVPLPRSFWSKPEWKPIFSKQRLLAVGLLKLYSERAVIAALKNPLARGIITLGLQSVLDPIIKAEEVKLTQVREVSKLKSVQTVTGKMERPRTPFGSAKTLMSKLRGL